MAILQEEQDLSSRNLDQLLEELEAPFDLPAPRFSQDQVQFLLKESSFPILVGLLKEIQADFLNQQTSNLFYRFVEEPLHSGAASGLRKFLAKVEISAGLLELVQALLSEFKTVVRLNFKQVLRKI